MHWWTWLIGFSVQRSISLREGYGLSSSFDSLGHIVRAPNWETADEKKVPNSVRARARAKRVGSEELGVRSESLEENRCAERL